MIIKDLEGGLINMDAVERMFAFWPFDADYDHVQLRVWLKSGEKFTLFTSTKEHCELVLNGIFRAAKLGKPVFDILLYAQEQKEIGNV